MSKLHLRYEDSRKVPTSTGPPSQVGEDNPRARELGSRITEKEIKRVAAVAAADASKWELDSPRVWCVELDSEVSRLHSEDDVVKQVLAEVAKLGRDAEKKTVSLTDSANMRDEAV